MKHLVSISDANIPYLLSSAHCIENTFINYKFNKILTNLFYEPSTRTSSSFASAMYKLGGKVISINDVNYSSVAKGENLEDTIRTMGTFCDAIVLRSKNKGEAARAAFVSEVPVINAGDGNGEHPTQTLADLYTIHKEFERLDNLTVTFVGDIENGRTVHSLDKALPDCEKHFIDTFDKSIWPASDVYYLTRVQKERGSEGSYCMRKEHIKHIPDHAIVMHPFPRNEEIPTWFDNDPRARYFQQMRNGLIMRMAILADIFSNEK